MRTHPQNPKCVGSSKGVGKRDVPFCVLLKDRALAQGSVVSNELENEVLSWAGQKTLGEFKHQRCECCFLEEYGRWIKLYRTKKTNLHCICISEGLPGWTIDRSSPSHRTKGVRRGRLVSRPVSSPDIIRHVLKDPLSDVDAYDGRFGADSPLPDPMYADAGLDLAPRPSILTGELRPYYASVSSQGKHVLDSVPEPG